MESMMQPQGGLQLDDLEPDVCSLIFQRVVDSGSTGAHCTASYHAMHAHSEASMVAELRSLHFSRETLDARAASLACAPLSALLRVCRRWRDIVLRARVVTALAVTRVPQRLPTSVEALFVRLHQHSADSTMADLAGLVTGLPRLRTLVVSTAAFAPTTPPLSGASAPSSSSAHAEVPCFPHADLAALLAAVAAAARLEQLHLPAFSTLCIPSSVELQLRANLKVTRHSAHPVHILPPSLRALTLGSSAAAMLRVEDLQVLTCLTRFNADAASQLTHVPPLASLRSVSVEQLHESRRHMQWGIGSATEGTPQGCCPLLHSIASLSDLTHLAFSPPPPADEASFPFVCDADNAICTKRTLCSAACSRSNALSWACAPVLVELLLGAVAPVHSLAGVQELLALTKLDATVACDRLRAPPRAASGSSSSNGASDSAGGSTGEASPFAPISALHNLRHLRVRFRSQRPEVLILQQQEIDEDPFVQPAYLCDADLACCSGLSCLTELDLEFQRGDRVGCPFAGHGLSYLAASAPTLRVLRLARGVQITPALAAALSAFSQLETVLLHDERAPTGSFFLTALHAVLAALAGLDHLRHLTLDFLDEYSEADWLLLSSSSAAAPPGAEVTIADMPRLEHLTIRALQRVSVLHLQRLPALHTLRLTMRGTAGGFDCAVARSVALGLRTVLVRLDSPDCVVPPGLLRACGLRCVQKLSLLESLQRRSASSALVGKSPHVTARICAVLVDVLSVAMHGFGSALGYLRAGAKLSSDRRHGTSGEDSAELGEQLRRLEIEMGQAPEVQLGGMPRLQELVLNCRLHERVFDAHKALTALTALNLCMPLPYLGPVTNGRRGGCRSLRESPPAPALAQSLCATVACITSLRRLALRRFNASSGGTPAARMALLDTLRQLACLTALELGGGDVIREDLVAPLWNSRFTKTRMATKAMVTCHVGPKELHALSRVLGAWRDLPVLWLGLVCCECQAIADVVHTMVPPQHAIVVSADSRLDIMAEFDADDQDVAEPVPLFVM